MYIYIIYVYIYVCVCVCVCRDVRALDVVTWRNFLVYTFLFKFL